MTPPYALRPALAADHDLLLRVYASTREEELAPVPWTAEQKAAFVRSQFEAQHSHYHQHYDDARFDVIMVAGVPAGRLYVHRGPADIRLMDIALLPEHRRTGVGTALLESLISEARAAKKSLSIHVEQFNPALQLYVRLGFAPVKQVGIYLLMEIR